MNTYKLALEALKRDARHSVGLSQEQAQSLCESLQPIGAALQTYQTKTLSIRKNSMLSDAGKNAEVDQARNEAFDAIVSHAASVDRTKIISDLAQRVSTRVQGTRTKAAAAQKDATALAAELRQSVLPALIRKGEGMQISPARTAEKMALKAAENYAANPGKAETVLSALSVGWPWCPDLPEGTLAQVESIIAQTVASDEQSALLQAKGIQALIDKVVAAAGQSLKELG